MTTRDFGSTHQWSVIFGSPAALAPLLVDVAIVQARYDAALGLPKLLGLQVSGSLLVIGDLDR